MLHPKISQALLYIIFLCILPLDWLPKKVACNTQPYQACINLICSSKLAVPAVRSPRMTATNFRERPSKKTSDAILFFWSCFVFFVCPTSRMLRLEKKLCPELHPQARLGAWRRLHMEEIACLARFTAISFSYQVGIQACLLCHVLCAFCIGPWYFLTARAAHSSSHARLLLASLSPDILRI